MSTPTLPSEIPILIVGAGPAGLALACTLLNKGVPPSSVLIVERESLIGKQARHNQSRALVIQPRTLERLEESVDDPSAPAPSPPAEGQPSRSIAIDENIRSTVQTILNRARIVERLAMRKPGPVKPLLITPFNLLRHDTRYPFMTIHSQASTESILESRFHTLGGLVHREWSLESFDLTGEISIGEPVSVKLVHSSGARAELQSKILVGADGCHSKVRVGSGIEFPGSVYPGTIMLGDVKFKCAEWPLFADGGYNGYEITQIFSTAGFLLLIPLPDGIVRLIATEHKSTAETQKNNAVRSGGHREDHRVPTQAELQAVLNVRGPKPVAACDDHNTITEVTWASRFRISRRIVPTYTKGAVCLIGDAAHVHSPAGGQGMNTGVQDGITLGLTLSGFFQPSSVLTPSASASLSVQLHAWSTKRHGVGMQVLGLSDQLMRLIQIRNPILIWIRCRLMPILAFFPGLLRRQLRKLTGLNYR